MELPNFFGPREEMFIKSLYISTALKYGLFLEEQENMVNVYGKPVEWWKGIMVNGVLKENWNLYSKILLYRASFHCSNDNWKFCYSYSRAFTIPLQISKPGKNKQALFLIAFIKLVDRVELKNTLSPSTKYPSCGLKTVGILSKYGPGTNFTGADRLLVSEPT